MGRSKKKDDEVKLRHRAEENLTPRQQAERRVEEKKKFYAHFSSFVFVNTFLFILNMITSPGNWWFYWPLLGWGLSIVIHASKVFGFPVFGWLSPKWEERQIEKEEERIRAKQEEHAWRRERDARLEDEIKALREDNSLDGMNLEEPEDLLKEIEEKRRRRI